ncbi:hypothetical protein [Myxococcus xanthus]|uniref:hypothetical protein n=1 Tax=Myxococcus xanthus TaxID=34 RepID=UPI00112A36C3|nr:hypothetical protein [Myxococcus xanthus]
MTTLEIPGLLLAAVLSAPEQPTWFEWVKLGIPVIIPSMLTAGIVGWASFRFNRRLEEQRRVYSEELARLNIALNTSLQEKLEADRAQRTEALEHIKRDLQDTLASKARRVEYLKTQISTIYGPLAFILELCNLRVQAAQKINNAAEAILKRSEERGPSAFLNDVEANEWTATVNRYFELSDKSNDEAIKLLQVGWSWIDEDDQAIALQFVYGVERSKIEFQEKQGRRLASKFYSQALLAADALEAPVVVNPTFVSRMRDKLYAKQRELSGLTVLHEQRLSHSASLSSQSTVKQAG